MKQNLNQQTAKLKAVDVGAYISKDMYAALTEAYQLQYPGSVSEFIVSKALLQKVLRMSDALTGIRFMYGLSDALNPNSLHLFLIPCTSVSEYDMASKPLVSTQGYYDHFGQKHTLTAIAEMMANHVQSMSRRDSDLVYKQVTRGNFIGKNSLQNLIRDEECSAIRYHLGLEGKVINAVFEPLDAGTDSFGLYMDFTSPCPNSCPGPDDKGVECFTSLAVHSNAQESELDLYRWFRDNELLNVAGGEMLYELYYFISPLIATLMDQKSNKEEILQDLYFNKIQPFNRLVIGQKYQEATEFLKETLEELTESYSVALLDY